MTNPASHLRYSDLTYEIIGAAMEVHRILGPGFLESVYEEALCYELRLRKIPYERQIYLDIEYKGYRLPKKFKADLLIKNKVIVDNKATSSFAGIDEAKLINYLKATKIRVGLLLNFGAEELQIKRRVW